MMSSSRPTGGAATQEAMTPSASEVILRERAAEIEAIYALASTLQCNLDRRTLAVLVELVEKGVHPEALADIINEIRAEAGGGQ